MSFYDGLWNYQGKTYASLHEALLAAWPARRCGDG